MAAVPLQVPDDEARAAEDLDAEHLGRPVGALPVERECEAGEGGSQERRTDVGEL